MSEEQWREDEEQAFEEAVETQVVRDNRPLYFPFTNGAVLTVFNEGDSLRIVARTGQIIVVPCDQTQISILNAPDIEEDESL